MLRIDLVVNNLLASAMSYGEIRIQSDGSPWRPLIHCRDIARAFAAFARAPREAVHNQAVNVGGNRENYQVRDVGDQVQRLIPSAKVVYTGEVGADPRNYRVNFDRLGKVLPDFRLQYNLVSGMEELHRKMVEHGFSKKDFEGDQFVRLRTLKGRFDTPRSGRHARLMRPKPGDDPSRLGRRRASDVPHEGAKAADGCQGGYPNVPTSLTSCLLSPVRRRKPVQRPAGPGDLLLQSRGAAAPRARWPGIPPREFR